ncbi:phosphoserine transaminase [Schaalia vaccimaxillae]|uniref:phosphoserine transaminase n=1 Tax=Schaalia vaccimaxillae TaxID=183916 RepID=UPI00047C04C1|nr:phosphoserine transaminase [Schaalia vaccimaxillae]
METFPALPPQILPVDGRFGSGPSRIRPEQIAAVSSTGLMGTSHRQPPVKNLVARIRHGLAELLSVPSDYTIALGNGGATAFWDIACASLIRRTAVFAVSGEFGAKFADEAAAAPHLSAPIVVRANNGELARLTGRETDGDLVPDVFAYAQHETSTGIIAPVERLGSTDCLTLVDATSIAGGCPVDLTQTDAYYFSPQKCFGSDGGLWVAILSPAAVARAEELSAASDRWIPKFLDLKSAIANSVKDQTLNTPAVATLIMLAEQIDWMLDNGGIDAMYARAQAASDAIYSWAEASQVARPFVTDPTLRSPVVTTIEFDEAVDAKALAAHLRQAGIVDIGAYRGVGANQLRIATWPATPIEDVHALLTSIDYALEHRS